MKQNADDFLSWFIAQGKLLIPKKLLDFLLPYYHHVLAILGAVYYRFPSNKLIVIGVTGTKGKSSTVEIINAILEERGFKTALSSTIRFKIDTNSKQNFYRMTMPGRFFLQKFLREAVDSDCSHAVIEMTSEGTTQYRHKFISLDALIVTNIAREHIESHGSFENYMRAKISIVKSLAASNKKNKVLILNADDPHVKSFQSEGVNNTKFYRLEDIAPYTATSAGSVFNYDNVEITTKLPGELNLYNILAALTIAKSLEIPIDISSTAIKKLSKIPGRMERIWVDDKNGKPFTRFSVVVDYAHTPESLTEAYQAWKEAPKICVFGGAGGGRDKWKREDMGKIAARNCKEIILTTQDPYDENPFEIISDIKKGINKISSDTEKPSVEIIIERGDAIRTAITRAQSGDVVIITGKGTDPFIMGPRGTKTAWNDIDTTREILKEYIQKKSLA
tara:strand:- start:3784 stop:5127 length:1344 start_codon:yes stop_codon:yes gene_type:complete